MLPGIDCGIIAVPEPYLFGTHWWQHREWAKCTFQEWTRLLWWLAVDRWVAPRHAAVHAAHQPGRIALSSLPAAKK